GVAFGKLIEPVSSTITLDVGCATTWQQGGTASRGGVQRVQWAESDRSSPFSGAASPAGLSCMRVGHFEVTRWTSAGKLPKVRVTVLKVLEGRSS
ncbi:hypothetical protein CH063_09260, partial [Colletotrichum higginsianum]